MLTELQRLHAAIIRSLDDLAALTAEPEPPMDRLPGVRLALTRASRTRTLFLERSYSHLLVRASGSQREAVEALQAEGKTQLVASAQHIGSWTPAEIEKRWPEYCAASSQMRAAMRERIRKEAQVLYPLLCGLERDAFAA